MGLTGAATLHLPWWVWALVAGLAVLSYFERQQRANMRAKHRAYLRGPEWRKRRREALERAGGRCMDCGSSDGLHVHHLTYKRWGNEEARDLRVLCARCHSRRHRGGRLDDLLDRLFG